MLGFLLRFVKGGNKFAIAGGCHLVNVSQGIMGARWPWEGWKPNMEELEVSVILTKENVQTRSNFFTVYLFIFWMPCFHHVCFKWNTSDTPTEVLLKPF